MGKIKFIIFAFVFLFVGYAAGNFFPFGGFSFFSPSIEGNTMLQVRATMDNGTPVAKLEIDLGEKPGPPPRGGVSHTDENGVAIFNVKPGEYVIYFNSGTFPKNLNMIGLVPVSVMEGKINEKTVVFMAK